MTRTDVREEIKNVAEESLAREIKDRLEEKVLGLSDSIERSKAKRFKADDKTKKVKELFEKYFKSEHFLKLGLQKINLKQGRWPWNSDEFEGDIEPDQEIKDAKRTRPSHDDAAQQSLRELNTYLTHKSKEREDSSIFAETYKTFLAMLCHKLIERVELLKEKEQKLFFYRLFREFLTNIWEDSELLNPAVRGDKSRLHIEDFIFEQMRITEERICYLSHEEASSALMSWAETLDQELAALHMCGARTFHFLLQNKPIPDNLDKYLKTISSTYHRLLLPEDKKSSLGSPLKLINKNKKYWDKISQIAKRKLKEAKQSEPFELIKLTPLFQSGVLSLEEALSVNFNDYYTVDQCLYLVLYRPCDLPLSSSEQIDLFGTHEFLELYRTSKNPLSGFQWLSWHIQEASYKLPALEVILQVNPENKEEFSHLLKDLVEQVKNLQQTSNFCPEISELGALPELKYAVSYQTQVLDEFENHLKKLQRHLHSLVLIRTLLTQYRQILPQTGELIGALAFQTDFTLLAQIAGQMIKEIQIESAHLLPLQGMGFSGSLDSSQTLVVSRQTSLLDIVSGIKKPQEGLIAWRSHRALREKSLEDLEIRLSTSQNHLSKVHGYLSSKRVQKLAQRAKIQFNIARIMLSEGLSDHLSEQQRSGLKQGEAVITHWFKVIDTGLSEQKILPQADDKFKEKKEKVERKQRIIEPVASISGNRVGFQSREIDLKEKMEPITQALELFIHKAHELLKTDSKELLSNWSNLLLTEQEVFFSKFLKAKNQFNDDMWIRFFKDKLGFLFSPLPQIQKPARFLWWYRHTIKDRQLFFSLLAVNTIISNAQKQPLTVFQKENLKKIVNFQKEIIDEQKEAAWSWFDSIHCYIKSKLSMSSVSFSQIMHEVIALPTFEAKSEEKAIKEIQVESEIKKLTSSPLEFGMQFPTILHPECKPATQAWFAYEEKLKKISDLEKQRLIVTFFGSALFHIEQRKLSINNDIDMAIRFKAVILMFVEVIKTTKFIDSVLGVAISSLNKCFTENSQAVQHLFFIKQAKTIVKNYQELLPSDLSTTLLLSV